MFTANFFAYFVVSEIPRRGRPAQDYQSRQSAEVLLHFYLLFFFFCSGSWGKEKAKPQTKLWQIFLHFKYLLFVIEITFFNAKALSLNFLFRPGNPKA